MLLTDILKRKKSPQVPFWFMRQAGRYLPEYKKVRAKFPDFLNFCYTPEAASQVTLQPIARFDMSAAIIFSDILVIPDALGMEVAFIENTGPVLTPIRGEKDVRKISNKDTQERLAPVYEAIRITRDNLAKEKALIGFCGAPWTLACYMIQGKSSRDFSEARRFALKEPELFAQIMAVLVDAVTDHAGRQIEAGADVIQLFDSWSGVLSETEFKNYVTLPTKEIVRRIKEIYPKTPIIGFPRMCGAKVKSYAKKTGVDAVSIDGSISLSYASDEIEKLAVLQGNLDSHILAEDKQMALEETQKILGHFKGRPFIFNLAHGILPHTPIENVQAVSDMIKASA